MSDSRAMVLVDEHEAALKKKANELYPDARGSRVNMARGVNDDSALKAGKEAGSSIRISKALGN